MEQEAKEFYTPEEIADRLQLNKMTIYRFMNRGELPYYQIGNQKRISGKDFQAFLDKMRRHGKDEN